MRKELKQYANRQLRFTGIFDRFGTIKRNDRIIKTVILNNVYSKEHDLLIDHVWIKPNKRWYKIGEIETGSIVAFNALVFKYFKHGGKRDYGLKNVKNVKKMEDSL